MKCYECGGEYREVQNVTLRVDDKLIGTYTVTNVSYKECAGCKSRLFSPENAEKRETARAQALDAILQAKPLRDFISAADTAAALGISRQALHKHRRISRGFIYHTAFGGSKVYLKKSVERFIVKGDGRYRLREPLPPPVTYEHGSRETQTQPSDFFAKGSPLLGGAPGVTKISSIVGTAKIKETFYAYSH